MPHEESLISKSLRVNARNEEEDGEELVEGVEFEKSRVLESNPNKNSKESLFNRRSSSGKRNLRYL